MTNEIANKAAGALAAFAGLKAGLTNVQAAAPMASGGDDILKMDTHGVWMFGADNVKVEKGSHWAINPLSIRHGWVCWKYVPEGSKEKREKLGEKVYAMTEQLPPKASLPQFGERDEWKQFMSAQFKCLDGSDEGEQVLYAPSSGGGIDAFVGRDRAGGFVAEIVKQLDKNPEKCIPVVELESDSYKNTTYGGSTFFPVIKIVDWVAFTEFEELESDKAEAPAADKPEVQNARRTTKPEAAAPEPAPFDTDDLTEEERELAAKIAARKAAAATQQPAASAPAEAPASSGEVRRRRRAA